MSKPVQYRKKPVVIEAMQYTDANENATAIIDWALANGTSIHYWCGNDEQCRGGEHVLRIPTLEGTMDAKVGWWIIKGIKGEFYPCDPDIFAATYDAVD